MDSETRNCQNCHKDFVIKSEDFDFYQKMGAPVPKNCFYCRLQKLLAFWPFAKFNKRKCDLSGEKIISIYPAGSQFPVYKSSHWYSDKWETPYMDYNFSKSFFDQLSELQKKCPIPHQFGTNNQDCDYSDDVWDSKNCYLCRSLASCENLSYSFRNVRCRDSYDLLYCYDSEQSYDCIYCFKVYNVHYAFDSRDSMDSYFLYDCRNVRNCFMCWNLRNKEYHILNQPYTKEEYFRKIEEFNLRSWTALQSLRNQFREHIKNDAIHKINFNVKTANSDGNYLTECKNCHEAYFLEESEDCSYYCRGLQNKNVYDSAGIYKGELVWNINQLADGYNLKSCNYCTNCRDSEYLNFCFNCENCFGCTGLRNKRYCVLNKQYSENEYSELVSQIKESMEEGGVYGEFFPYDMVYGGYNLSTAGILFPKTKEEVKDFRGAWEELEDSDLSGLNISDFVDSIDDFSGDITGAVFVCQESSRPYNIKKEEFEFYKKHQIPLPRNYPDVRTMKRVADLFYIVGRKTSCYFCGKEIICYYPESMGYKKIACEECYLKEVV
ncbi:MAG: hypothetical protein UV58_C0004G0062 [Candidatus Wolfebacteria bacterium GW2011_GWC1_43_10]|nr:MAG: hypothetical protein UV58_C0004G0062 [Candidatus Wolfebacteria bacterium GW2011_GWC1_43_10]KKT22787.1 MAG: hypothetical protein UW08_C0003G0023 [Parcubacteria group bacterium GW2011_GWB1_43_8b]